MSNAPSRKSKQQSEKRKNFIYKNEAFSCDNCGFEVPKASQTARNHCPKCLYSKHVDRDIPGDRLAMNLCAGLMKPIEINMAANEPYVVQECMLCAKKHKNKILPDDSRDAIVDWFKQHNKFE